MSFKSKFKRCFNTFMKFSDMLTDSHVFAYAAQASFFVIISAVPFLMLIINILQAVLPVSQEYFISAIAMLPVQIQALAEDLVADFYTNSSVSLVSVTTVFLLWTASRGVKAISSGLKVVFNTLDETNYIKSTFWSLVYTILFMVSIVVTAALLLFGKYIAQLIEKYIPAFHRVVELVLDLRYLVLLVFLILVFMSAYKFLGKSKIKFRGQFVGAVLSSGFWLVFSYAYSLYVQNMGRMSYIYGSLAAVVFLMLWLWFCMTALLFGAEVNRWLYEHDVSLWRLIKKGITKKRKQIQNQKTNNIKK